MLHRDNGMTLPLKACHFLRCSVPSVIYARYLKLIRKIEIENCLHGRIKILRLLGSAFQMNNCRFFIVLSRKDNSVVVEKFTITMTYLALRTELRHRPRDCRLSVVASDLLMIFIPPKYMIISA